MAALPAAGGAAPAGPRGAPAAAASPPALALEVTGLPQSLPGADLAALLAHLRTLGKVVTAFAQPGGGSGGSGGSGSALVLLPPGTPPATAAQLAAGGLLGGCQLDVSTLRVSLCSDPAGWVQKAVGVELLAGAAAVHPPVSPPQQPPAPEGMKGQSKASPVKTEACPADSACDDGSSGGVVAGCTEAAGAGADACPSPSSGSGSGSLSRASSGALPRSPLHGTSINGGGDVGSRLRRSGSSSGSLAASSDRSSEAADPPAGGNRCLVVHNLSPYLSAWQVVEFFSQFGQVAECTKRPGSTLAFVHFAQAADAARAKEAVHYRVVPHLGQREALSIQFRKQQPSRSHASATPFSGGAAQSGSRSRSGGGSPCSEAGTSEGGSSESGGSEGSGSDAGGSQGPCSDAGGGNSWGGSEAGECWGPPRSEQCLSSGRALVVKNLPPSLPYEAVRVFFSQFGKLTSCYKQTQAPFAFLTYSRPESAAVALRAVNGTLCPDLNVSSLIRVEYRRGVGAAQQQRGAAEAQHNSGGGGCSSFGGSSVGGGGSTRGGQDQGSPPAGSASSDGSGLSCCSESIHSDNAAFAECCESSIRAVHASAPTTLAFRSHSGGLEGPPFPCPPAAYAVNGYVAFAYPCYLAPI